MCLKKSVSVSVMTGTRFNNVWAANEGLCCINLFMHYMMQMLNEYATYNIVCKNNIYICF